MSDLELPTVRVAAVHARERVRTGGEPEGTISWGQLMADLGPAE